MTRKNVRLFAAAFIGLLGFAFARAPAADWYVDASSTAVPPVVGYGGSWAVAFPFLQDALTAAQPGDTILIAQGIYYPDDDDDFPIIPGSTHTPLDRTQPFVMTPEVEIFGGFRGIAGLPNDANIRDVETILSGDIDHDGLLDSQNSRTVMQAGTTAVPIENDAQINGVTQYCPAKSRIAARGYDLDCRQMCFCCLKSPARWGFSRKS